jgi:hypothetical protein
VRRQQLPRGVVRASVQGAETPATPIAPVPRARRCRRADDGVEHPDQLNVEEHVEVVHMNEKRMPQVKYRGLDDLGGSGSLHGLFAVELMHEPDHPQPQRAGAEDPHG